MVPQLTPVGGAPNPNTTPQDNAPDNARYLTVEEFRHVMTAMLQASKEGRDVVFEEGAFQVNLPELKPPDVRVQPAEVNITLPEITVQSPDVTVEPAEVNVEVHGARSKRTLTLPDGRKATVEELPLEDE
jgi:hypothetical protein